MFARRLLYLVPCCSLLSGSVAFAQAKPEQATTQIVAAHPDALHPGDEIAFRVRLNEPLPPGAYFSVRLSPVSFNSEYAIGSGEPIDADRKEFLVKSKLPDGAFGGEWHIAVIYLFLAGTSWTSNTINFNDVHFKVEGKKYDVPTSAMVKLENH